MLIKKYQLLIGVSLLMWCDEQITVRALFIIGLLKMLILNFFCSQSVKLCVILGWMGTSDVVKLHCRTF